MSVRAPLVLVPSRASKGQTCKELVHSRLSGSKGDQRMQAVDGISIPDVVHTSDWHKCQACIWAWGVADATGGLHLAR